MEAKLNCCPDCQNILPKPYEANHMGMMYMEFFECEHCGKQLTHVYRFSHVESDDEDSD